MAERLRRRQDDDGVARPPHPPLRHSRNRQRELAFQEPHLTSPSEPIADRPRGPTAPPHARRSVAREGTARRARVPSMDSGDDRYSTAGVGLDWTLIPGPASALIDRTASLRSALCPLTQLSAQSRGCALSPLRPTARRPACYRLALVRFPLIKII